MKSEHVFLSPAFLPQRLVSPLLFLTPRLPSFLMSRRLQRHGSQLLHLDRALSRMGVQNLSEAELRQVSLSQSLNVCICIHVSMDCVYIGIYIFLYIFVFYIRMVGNGISISVCTHKLKG